MEVEKDDFRVGDATQNAIEIETENTIYEEVREVEEVEEEANESISKWIQHGEKVMAVAKKGKTAGQESVHYKCN